SWNIPIQEMSFRIPRLFGPGAWSPSYRRRKVWSRIARTGEIDPDVIDHIPLSLRSLATVGFMSRQLPISFLVEPINAVSLFHVAGIMLVPMFRYGRFVIDSCFDAQWMELTVDPVFPKSRLAAWLFLIFRLACHDPGVFVRPV